MRITSGRRPAITPMTLAMRSRPCGVSASKASTRGAMPDFLSSARMYSRVFAPAGDPATRGPMATSRSTCRKAASPLNDVPGAAWAPRPHSPSTPTTPRTAITPTPRAVIAPVPSWANARAPRSRFHPDGPVVVHGEEKGALGHQVGEAVQPALRGERIDDPEAHGVLGAA